MYCDTIEAALYLREGNVLEARTLFHKCLQFAQGQLVDPITYCLERLGDIKNNLEIHKALQFLGDANLAEGNHDTALNLFTLALNGFNEMDIHRSRAECMLKLGDIAAKFHGDSSKAVEHWERARRLFERSSQEKQLVQIDERLAGHQNLLRPEPIITHRLVETMEAQMI
ncbi:hypothetical protein FB451DRAFT_1258596 [Mycena latifolia]|nr:hypothetical protein FB451DRAFT_1258596 [Mycena latifolia]